MGTPPTDDQVLEHEQMLQTAMQHQRAGRLAQAEQLYRQVLASDPQQPVALHMLGVLAHMAG